MSRLWQLRPPRMMSSEFMTSVKKRELYHREIYSTKNQSLLSDIVNQIRGYTPYIYSMDIMPEKGLEKPHFRRGHEASTYITYIVDHYDELHPYTIFIHGNENQWHNDVLGPKTHNLLRNMRLQAVSAHGYINLRCKNDPCCPSTLHQMSPMPHDLQ